MGAFNVPWTESKYSKNQINKAGKKICRDDIAEEEKKEAYKIVGNWRASHAYPLYVVSHKLRRMCGKTSMVVHRLKRMDSIIGKLKRFENMSLFGMQDLGGCRVIIPTIEDVYSIADEYENSRIRHRLYKENDYIKSPKPDGYRSLHRVYEYRSDDDRSKYNKMKIEVQFRTKLQHLWATAVEVMSLYTKSNLKAGLGENQYFRFFALISSAFAIIEGMETVPSTPDCIEELAFEIKELDKQYSILEKLESTSHAIRTHKIVNIDGNYDYFLISLNFTAGETKIRAYTKAELNNAIEDYNMMEMIPDINNVLASAKSIKELQEAYPNYFGDVKEFLELVYKIIDK